MMRRILIATALICLPLSSSHVDAAAPCAAKVSIEIGALRSEEGGDKNAQPGPLRSPFGVDFARDGLMYIVELGGGRVHRRGKDGKVEVIAGDGSKSYQGDGGAARQATFNGMHNLAISRDDKLYIADSWNHCIREIDLTTQRIRTIAGTGEAGFSGDGGPAREATFDYVMCITLTPAEDAILIADLRNRRIRRMDLQSGVVETVAGNGKRGIPSDGGRAVEEPLVDPRAVAADSAGNIYVLERGGHALRVVRSDGTIQTVAGTGTRGYRDGPALEAQFGSPKHLCLDDADRVYIADDVNGAVRCYDPQTKSVSTLLGQGRGAPKLRLKNPHGVTYEQGKLYVVDMGHDRIVKVDLEK